MSESTSRHEAHDWEDLTPDQVLTSIVYELYSPVSLLGSKLNRLTGDEDPLTEEEYEAIFTQMQEAVDQLSKTVVNLKRYTKARLPDPPDVS